MSLLSRSFDEYTVAWIVISSFAGGLVGASVKFVFEDLLRPRLGYQRETSRIVRQYTTPLIRSAESLERRINNFVRNEDRHWFDENEYYRLSTLYVFGEHLGWVRIIERKFGFLPIESTRRGRRLNARLNGVLRGLTSPAYFKREEREAASGSGVPRLMVTAIGEAMTAGHDGVVMEFTEFATRYVKDAQFQRWFEELDGFLRAAHPANPFAWDRLIIAEAQLRALVCFLDPKGAMAKRRLVDNLELLSRPEIGEQLAREFPKLVPRVKSRHGLRG